MKPYTYLLINLGCFLVPFVASFYPKRAFYKEWRRFFAANFLVAVLFISWDCVFTKWEVWGFNPDYLTGIYILNLPLEEVLFFICIPYACVFTYFALKFLLVNNPISKYQKYMSIVFLIFLTILMIAGFGNLYTTMTTILTILFLLFCLIKEVDMSYYYLSYLLILPFFLLSNGILTGSFLDSPIVWYDDTENIGIRLYTIPIEDSVYGFLLVASNISLFEYFKGIFYSSSIKSK